MPLRNGNCPLDKFVSDGTGYNADPVEACLGCNFADNGVEGFDIERICQCPSEMSWPRYEELKQDFLESGLEKTKQNFVRFVKENYHKRVKLVTGGEEIKQLYEFIKSRPLDYPGYLRWVEKCRRELELGSKNAFVYLVGENIVANAVFQAHKQDPFVLEIKNMRVEEPYRRNGIFKKLVKRVGDYAGASGFRRLVCDCHAGNEEVIAALTAVGFEVEGNERLYDDKFETILAKRL